MSSTIRPPSSSFLPATGMGTGGTLPIGDAAAQADDVVASGTAPFAPPSPEAFTEKYAPSPAPVKPGIFREPPAGHGFAMGPTLRMDHRQMLLQTQALSLSPRLAFPEDRYAEVYERARKLHFRDDVLGLDFETAVISRMDLPELIAMGSAGYMVGGFTFVVEDFFVDLDEERRATFIKLIAVHEYGEQLFGDHHDATMLEFAVAEHMGVLEDYLAFLKSHCLVKFRDVALFRLKESFGKALREEGINIDDAAFERGGHHAEDASACAAHDLAERFRMPAKLVARYEGIDEEDLGVLEEKVGEWVAYVAVLEQVQAFHRRALDDVREAVRAYAAVHGTEEMFSTSFKLSLAIRLALFRTLGVLQAEIDEGVLEASSLGDDVYRKLLSELGEGIVSIVSEELKDGRSRSHYDDLIGADASWLTVFARLDAAIWQAMGMELRLVPDENAPGGGDEDDLGEDERAERAAQQPPIEQERRRAWDYALEDLLTGNHSLKREQKQLKRYAKFLRRYRELQEAIDAVLAPSRGGSASCGKFVIDAIDGADVVAADLAEGIARAAEGFGAKEVRAFADRIQARVDAALPAIWEAFAQRHGLEGVAFASVQEVLRVSVRAVAEGLDGEASPLRADIARLKRLAARWKDAAGDAQLRTLLESGLRRLSQRSDFPRMVDQGMVPEELGVRLRTLELTEQIGRIPAIVTRLLPRLDVLPFELRFTDGGLPEVIAAHRRRFLAGLGEESMLAGRLSRTALASFERLWDDVGKAWGERLEPLFALARFAPEALPELAAALEGQSADALWQRFDFRGAVAASAAAPLPAMPDERKSAERWANRHDETLKEPSAKVSPVECDIVDDEDGWMRTAAFSARRLLSYASGWRPQVLRDQASLGVAAALLHWEASKLRDRVRASAAQELGLSPEEVEAKLPSFDADLAAFLRLCGQSSRRDAHTWIDAARQALYAAFWDRSQGGTDSPSRADELDVVAAALDLPVARRMLEIFENGSRKVGYDRYGELSTRRREWNLSSVVARMNFDLVRALRMHFRKAILQYGERVDLATAEAAAGLRALLGDIETVRHLVAAEPQDTRYVVDINRALCLLRSQVLRLLLLSEMRRGKHLRGPADAVAFVRREFPAFADLDDLRLQELLEALPPKQDSLREPSVRTQQQIDAAYTPAGASAEADAVPKDDPAGARMAAITSQIPAWREAIQRFIGAAPAAAALEGMTALQREIEEAFEVLPNERRQAFFKKEGRILWDGRIAWIMVAILCGHRVRTRQDGFWLMREHVRQVSQMQIHDFVRGIDVYGSKGWFLKLSRIFGRPRMWAEWPSSAADLEGVLARRPHRSRYDALGILSPEERAANTPTLADPIDVLESKEKNLRAHWDAVIGNLWFSRRTPEALAQIRDLLDDIEFVRLSHPFVDLEKMAWKARRKWVDIAFENGVNFTRMDDIQNRLIADYPYLKRVSYGSINLLLAQHGSCGRILEASRLREAPEKGK